MATRHFGRLLGEIPSWPLALGGGGIPFGGCFGREFFPRGFYLRRSRRFAELEKGGGGNEDLAVRAATGGGAEDLAGGTKEHGGAVHLNGTLELVLGEGGVGGDEADELDLVAVGDVFPGHEILADSHLKGVSVVLLRAGANTCLLDMKGINIEVGFAAGIEIRCRIHPDGVDEIIGELERGEFHDGSHGKGFGDGGC